MSGRTTAEIVTDLRNPMHRPGGLAEEAADRLDELDADVATLRAIIAGCPRCTQRAALRAEDP